MSSFTEPFDTRWLPEEGMWMVLTPFEYHSVAKDSGLFVRIEEGYKTDLASIPRLVRFLVPKVGKDAQAATLHDKIFQTGRMTVRIDDKEKDVPVTMGMANSIYYESMRVLKVSFLRYWFIRIGLSMGSWVVWNRYRAKDAECELTRH